MEKATSDLINSKNRRKFGSKQGRIRAWIEVFQIRREIGELYLCRYGHQDCSITNMGRCSHEVIASNAEELW